MNQTHETKKAIPDSALPPLPPVPPGAVEQIPDITVADRMRASEGAKSQEERSLAQGITEASNPANDSVTAFGVSRESRVAINVPDRRLEVPEIEGYHLHWFLETNIHKAKKAGYEFVGPAEAPEADRTIGGRSPGSHGESLGGDLVTQIGGTDKDGQPVQLVLMKIRQEWYLDDQRRIAQRNRAVLDQIFRKKQPLREPGESETDFAQRYTREAAFDMSNGRFRKIQK